jgi:methyl-accepting chemotaxis protein
MSLSLVNLKLSTKLWSLLSLSLLALAFLGGLAVYGTSTIQELGRTLYLDSSAASKLSASIALGVERAEGEVRAAPAILDLQQLKQSQQQLESELAALKKSLSETQGGAAQNVRMAAADVAQKLDVFAAAAGKVFKLTGEFAQQDAIAELSKSVAPAEAGLQAALKRLSDAAEANAAQQVQAMEDKGRAVARIVIAVGAVLLAGVCAAGYVIISRGVSRPILALSRTMLTLSRGDTGVAIPYAERRDEVGGMAAAVQVFKENMIKAEQLTAEQRAEQERKEQRQKAVDGYIAEFDKSVREALEALATAGTELRATATSMSATAEETQRQAATVASASEQASANVQTVAASAEEMTSSISEIGRQVAQAAEIAKQAVGDAQRTNGTVNTLAEAAQKIGQVVQLIQDIASQTNLLALNATIEAARAGEAGKGFAVVASEVKSLANQTAKATEEIAAQIGSIQTVTGEAVTAIQGIGGTIGHINEISTAIASAVEEQGAATQEIARNTQEAAKGTEQVSSNIAGVNRAAGETGSAASQVRASAEQLGRQSETLRADVNRFLEKIRAA